MTLLLAADGCADSAEEEPTPTVLEPSRVETAASLFDWSTLPVLQGRSYHQYSTHDRGVRTYEAFDANNIDFNNFIAVCGDRPKARDQVDLEGQCDPNVYRVSRVARLQLRVRR